MSETKQAYSTDSAALHGFDNMVSLSFVIINYNTPELTISCIKSIQTFFKKELEAQTFEIVLVDNHSHISSKEALETFSRQQKYITFVANGENDGFAKGCNIGVSHAKGTYILFLNSDTVLIDTLLEQAVQKLQDDQTIGVIGGKLQNEKGITSESAGSFYTVPRVFQMLFLQTKNKNLQTGQGVDWVSGGYMLVSAKLFKELNGFDEAFFMYVEDMEFCFRVKKRGYSVYFEPKLIALHKGQGSSNRTFAIVHIYKGILYFFKKHCSYLSYFSVKILLLVKSLLAIGIGFVTKNRYLIQTYRQTLPVVL